MGKITTILKMLLIFFSALIIIACENFSANTPTSNNYSNAVNAITIDNAGVIPIVDNRPTISVVYLHNNTNSTIKGITYSASVNTGANGTDMQQSATFIDINSAKQCSTIGPLQSCPLKFTTPVLPDYYTQGSALIALQYRNNNNNIVDFSQVLNFRNMDGVSSGVNFSSGVDISSFGHKIGYGTVYLYASGNNKTYIIKDISSNKFSVKIHNNNINGQQVAYNYVQAVEVSAIVTNKFVAATLYANSLEVIDSKKTINSGSIYTSTASVGVSTTASGGVLTMGEVSAINTAESATPGGSVLVTNAGNASIILGSKSATTGISNLAGCNSGTSLNVGASCTITFNVTQAGGSGTITLNYTGGVTASISQAINWFNSENGALANMNYSSPINFALKSTESSLITVTNIGGYNLTNISIPAPQVLNGAKATVTVSYPSSGSCQNATLNIGASCQYILNITDATIETNQQILFGVTGSYNNGSTQSYTRYAVLTYSISPYTYLYSTNYHGNNLTAYTVNTSSGRLVPTSDSPIACGIQPVGFIISPNNNFMYVANSASDTISVYSIESSNGFLTQISSPSAGIEPCCPILTPNGKFMYVPNRISHNISAYVVNTTTGALSSISGSPYNTGGSPLLTMDETGNYLYAATSNNNVQEYKINQSTGALSSIGTISTGDYPFSMAIDPDNKFLYVVNYYGNNMNAYTINQSTGVLSAIATYPAGANPSFVTVAPNGQFLYTLGNGNSVAGYTINTTTGGLTPIANFYSGDLAVNLEITPDNRFMYVLNNNGYDVTAFTINQSTGALTTIGTYATGYAPQNLLIDTVNGFLYVANASSNSVSAYAINSTTGALTAVAGSPFVSGNTPNGLQVLYVYP